MKNHSNYLKVCLFCFLGLAWMLSPKAGSGAITIYVGPSETYKTIQAGMDAARDGDTVLVRSETYSGEGNRGLNFAGKAFTMRSEKGPESCIIDCAGTGQAFTFTSSETSSSVLDGFTITGCDSGLGAIKCQSSSPTITNCIIKGNTGFSGGGLYCFWASPTLINCIFTDNSANQGGAIHCYYGSTPVLTHCTISGNSATKLENSGGEGGGIFLLNSSPTMTNCIVSGNTAGTGPDIYVSPTSSITVSFSALSGQLDGDGNPVFEGISVFDGGLLKVEGNIVIEESPFVGERDYHLKEGSGCIDKGTDKITLPETDFEGDPRNLGAGPDMGADETEPTAEVVEVPVEVDVKIDVKPGGKFNIINPKSRGVVPVAILGDGYLNLSDIDVDSLKFAGAGCVHSFIKDVNHDGVEDLLCFFRTRELKPFGRTIGATSLTGSLRNGDTLTGTDTVRLVPKRACGYIKHIRKGMEKRLHGRCGR
ncbi:MAG: right-handed parallel beta-helix repeat-containing protein [Deltaproteobacteria bacterium]